MNVILCGTSQSDIAGTNERGTLLMLTFISINCEVRESMNSESHPSKNTIGLYFYAKLTWLSLYYISHWGLNLDAMANQDNIQSMSSSWKHGAWWVLQLSQINAMFNQGFSVVQKNLEFYKFMGYFQLNNFVINYSDSFPVSITVKVKNFTSSWHIKFRNHCFDG